MRSAGVVRAARIGHLASMCAFLALLVFQVYLAGLALFDAGGFRMHVSFGYSFVWVVVFLIPILAWLGRIGRRDAWLSVLLFALYIAQCLLPPLAREGGPGLIAALHPVNAMLMFALSAWLSARAWQRLAHPLEEART